MDYARKPPTRKLDFPFEVEGFCQDELTGDMELKQREFTEEFKWEAVRILTTSGRGITSVAVASSISIRAYHWLGCTRPNEEGPRHQRLAESHRNPQA